MNRLIPLALLFILCPLVFADVVVVDDDAHASSHAGEESDKEEDREDDIILTVPQSDYYFLVGQNAVISLDLENNYGYSVNGLLQSTVAQTVGQFSTTRTQSSSLALANGTQTISLDFGTSDAPSSFMLDLSYSVDNVTVYLDSITVNFVSDESEQNNTQNQMQSSPTPPANNNQASNQSQQSIQQQIDNLTNQANPQDAQQRLQNNQLPQDNSALKQELQQQVQEENNLREAFERELLSHEDFQEMHNSILEQGNSVVNDTLNPASESAGTFEVNYQDQQQRWTKLQGSMANGTLTDIQQTSQQQNDQLLESLESDQRFQEYEDSLTPDGFARGAVEFNHQDNGATVLSLQYVSENQEDAAITAVFDEDDNLTSVELERPSDNLILFALFAVVLCGIVGYLLYRRFKTNKTPSPYTVPCKEPREFDYIAASGDLIKQAKVDFDRGQYKDAYGKIAQSIRLYLSYELDLQKEITNEDILLHLDGTTYPVEQISECFKHSSLVEFAKSDADKTEFDEMIIVATQLIKQKTDDSS